MIPDLVKHNENGILYNSEDRNGLIEALTSAIKLSAVEVDNFRKKTETAINEIGWDKLSKIAYTELFQKEEYKVEKIQTEF